MKISELAVFVINSIGVVCVFFSIIFVKWTSESFNCSSLTKAVTAALVTRQILQDSERVEGEITIGIYSLTGVQRVNKGNTSKANHRE